jgi:UDP-N-acetylglucosamine--N-acetylmuramyl-(pentapeptide) pyrophosphoryl-undecaprenol N-acetylglucosamine transferase
MKVIMAGGATGGHLYPALAIADKIKRRNPEAEIRFIAAKREIGAGIVADNGYAIDYIDIRGFDRRNLLKNISVMKDLAVSSAQIRRLLRDFAPDMVIGTGGYVCGPVVREASKKGIKTYLHEQNVLPGMANRLAEKYAGRIFVGFEESRSYFKEQRKVVVTGNPVRRAFITAGAMQYREKLCVDSKEMGVLIFGGSHGAVYLNEIVTEMLILMKNDENLRFWFLTGKERGYFEIMKQLKDAGVALGTRVHLMEYTEAIHEYFAASDLIIARSGALTVSEIAVMGRASILVPSPNVTGNHQYFNAKTLSDKGAALLVEEKDLTAPMLAEEIQKLKSNKEVLNRMAKAAETQGRSDAVDVIYENIFKQ